jgi:hypothetical protein
MRGDIEVFDKCIELRFPGDNPVRLAWLRIKKDFEEAAPTAHNKRRGKRIMGIKIEYECTSDECNWKGKKEKCSSFKHEPTFLLCPECYEPVERARPAPRGRRKTLRKLAAQRITAKAQCGDCSECCYQQRFSSKCKLGRSND